MFKAFLPILLCSWAAFAAPVAHVTRAGNGTTSGINTSGATLLIVQWSDDQVRTALPSDSNGNTWQCLAPVAAVGVQIAYTCYAYGHGGSALVVGTGHTFSFSGGDLPFVMASAWANAPTSGGTVDPYDGVFRDKASASATNGNAGALTPVTNGDLLIATFASYTNVGALTIDTGFTILDQSPFVAATNYGGGNAYFTQAIAASINPRWTMSNGIPNAIYANIAAFKQSAAPTFVANVSVISVGP